MKNPLGDLAALAAYADDQGDGGAGMAVGGGGVKQETGASTAKSSGGAFPGVRDDTFSDFFGKKRAADSKVLEAFEAYEEDKREASQAQFVARVSSIVTRMLKDDDHFLPQKIVTPTKTISLTSGEFSKEMLDSSLDHVWIDTFLSTSHVPRGLIHAKCFKTDIAVVDDGKNGKNGGGEVHKELANLIANNLNKGRYLRVFLYVGKAVSKQYQSPRYFMQSNHPALARYQTYAPFLNYYYQHFHNRDPAVAKERMAAASAKQGDAGKAGAGAGSSFNTPRQHRPAEQQKGVSFDREFANSKESATEDAGDADEELAYQNYAIFHKPICEPSSAPPTLLRSQLFGLTQFSAPVLTCLTGLASSLHSNV